MELRHISAGLSKRDGTVAQMFARHLTEARWPRQRADAQRWLELVDYLAQSDDWPPQWVTMFRHRSALRFSEVDTWKPNNGRVEVIMDRQIEIRYRLPDAEAPWHGSWGTWIAGFTDSIQDAGQMIFHGLRRAAVDLHS